MEPYRRGSILRGILQLDLRSLALLRIGVAGLLLYDLWESCRELTEYYTDYGVLPRALVTEEYWNPAWWCLHLYSGEVGGQALLMGIHVAASLALLLGWRTRLASVTCYILTLSLQNRNPLVLDSSDRLLLLLLFWGMFMPWGLRFSKDAGAVSSAAQGQVVELLGSTGYLLQVCQLYLMAGYWKLHPVWMTERTALARVFEIKQFTKPLGEWLMSYPGLLEVLTLAVLVIELLAPCLLLTGNGRGRLLGVVLLALLHAGIGLTMDLEFFPWVSEVTLLGCLPSLVWDRSVSSRPGEAQVPPWTTHFLTQGLAALAILACLAWNTAVMLGNRQVPSRTGWSAPALDLMAAFRLVQFWDLFSPVPRPVDSRYYIEARMRDGRTIDLFRAGQPLNWTKAENSYREFRNQKQRNYLNSLEWSVGKPIVLRYLRRQAIAWEEAHPGQGVVWTRMISVRTSSRFSDPYLPPARVEIGAAVSPKSSWVGPLMMPYPSEMEAR